MDWLQLVLTLSTGGKAYKSHESTMKRARYVFKDNSKNDIIARRPATQSSEAERQVRVVDFQKQKSFMDSKNSGVIGKPEFEPITLSM